MRVITSNQLSMIRTSIHLEDLVLHFYWAEIAEVNKSLLKFQKDWWMCSDAEEHQASTRLSRFGAVSGFSLIASSILVLSTPAFNALPQPPNPHAISLLSSPLDHLLPTNQHTLRPIFHPSAPVIPFPSPSFDRFGIMGKSRISKQPSHYPPLAFHLIRLGQILSSIVVASVLFFFIHHLEIEHYNIPWTFLLVRAPIPMSLNQKLTS